MSESPLFVAVPDSARTVKAWFEKQPSTDFVRQLKRQIADGVPPYLIDCHTHTMPNLDGRVVYLDDFSLPATSANRAPRTPCPCCWPNHMKFRNGNIAWFPDERVVRFVGPQCLARLLSSEVHESAIAELKQRKVRERDVVYLLKNEDTIRQSYAALRSAQKVAYAIKEFSKNLLETLEERMALPLFAHARNGELLVEESVRDIDLKTGEAVEKAGMKLYATIPGYKILNPGLKDYPFALKSALQPAQFLTEFEDWKVWVASASDEERHKAAKIINSMVQRGRTMVAELKELQKFIDPLTINTLRRWGGLSQSPVTLLIERRDGSIAIGKTPGALFAVPIPAHFEDEIPELAMPLIKENEVEIPTGNELAPAA